jgi:O-antigen/teichoic acid export membrane protein
MLQRFLKDSVIFAVPSFLSRGLSLILIPLYTRVLSPADFGSFDLFMVFASVINLTIAFEISQGLARYFTSEEKKSSKRGYASSALWFTVICYSLFLLFAFIYSDSLSSVIFGKNNMIHPFRVGILYIYFNGIFLIAHNQFRWELRSISYSLVSIVLAVVTFFSSIYFVYFLKLKVAGVLLSMLLGTIVALILSLWWLRDTFRFLFIRSYLLRMLSFSIPLILSGLAVWMSLSIDRIMINYFLGTSSVGIYGIGCRFASISTLVLVGFQNSLTPLVYSNYLKKETPKEIARIFRVFMIISLNIFLAMVIISSDLLKLLTTSTYYGASLLVTFLIPAVFFGNMYIFAPGIAIAKKTRLVAYINIAGSVVNIILNYFLIQLYGVLGAAVSTLMSSVLVFTLYVILGNRFYRIPFDWIPILKTTSFAFILAYIVNNFPPVANLPLATKLLFIPLLFMISLAFKLLTVKEVVDLYRAITAKCLSII